MLAGLGARRQNLVIPDLSAQFRRFWLALAAAAALLAASPAAADTAAEKLAVKAKTAYDRGEFDTAAGLYYQAFAADATHGEWLYSSARASERAGLLDDAAQRYQAFLDDPRGYTDKIGLARQHLRDVHAERAKRMQRRASESPSPALGYPHARAAADLLFDNLDAWLLAAELADRAGLKPEAVECYKTAAQLAPNGSAEQRAAKQRIKAIGYVAPKKSAAEQKAEADRLRQFEEQRKKNAEEAARRKEIEDRQRAEEDEAERKAKQFQEEIAAKERARLAEEAAKEAEERRKHPVIVLPPRMLVAAPPEWLPKTAAGGALAMAAAGGVLLGLGSWQESRLRDDTAGFLDANNHTKPIPMSFADATARANNAALVKTVGAALVVSGAAVGALTAAWWGLAKVELPREQPPADAAWKWRLGWQAVAVEGQF